MASLLKWIFQATVAIGVSVGIAIGIFYGYMYFTDETSWVQNPIITPAGELQLHVKHKDGLPFVGPDGYHNVTLTTLERKSKRTREYRTLINVPSSYVDFLGHDGLRVRGYIVSRTTLDAGPIHACVFLKGDSVGCRPVSMP